MRGVLMFPGLIPLSLVFLLVSLLALLTRAKALLFRKKDAVGFFHPFTNDGGGGERVLWCAVKAIQKSIPHARIYIYSGDNMSSKDLSNRASERFGVELLRPVSIILLRNRTLVSASHYPSFTLLGQSLGSLFLAFEALFTLTPALFIDTAGYAFSYPVARLLFGCHVACYTHYPTISADMARRVQLRQPMYNNSATVAASSLLTWLKGAYYRVFAKMYSAAGSCADIIMVNSSWTQGHIQELWGGGGVGGGEGGGGGRGNKTGRKEQSKGTERVFLVYPPCATSALEAFPVCRPPGDRYIVSVSQFRPEKNHALQLRSFALARSLAAGTSSLSGVRLKFVGSCRGKEDEERVERLGALAEQLGIGPQVDFCVNVPYGELLQLLGHASAGLHAMLDEHFGISVVEYMAAGAIPIAHNSAGPKMDIVRPEGDQITGFLAASEEEFAAAIVQVFQLSSSEREKFVEAGRKRAQMFSEETFEITFLRAMHKLLRQALN